ncbi:MAG: response regulator transcription factor [Gemmatimonadota bacterium]|nr:response regulator transcription factor [Gemmatimonadota bacterium]
MTSRRHKIAVPEERRIRVLIVDDHPIVREGLSRLVDQELDMVMVGAAKDPASAREALGQSDPDIIVLDLSLPGITGFQFIEEVRSTYPDLPILILSMHAEPYTAERALKAGASGYITKAEAPEKVLTAIRMLRSNQVYVTDELARKIVRRMAGGGTDAPTASLSNRELQVLGLIGDGLSTRRIAERLDLSVKTVETYRGNIKRKLGLKDSAELVQYAVRFVLTEGR